MDVNAIPTAALPVMEPQLPPSARVGRQQGNDPAQAKKVAREFEAMFVGMMMKSMRETVKQDKLTGGGRGEETFRSLLDQEYAQAATQNGGLGLARMIEKELVRGNNPASAAKVTGNAD